MSDHLSLKDALYPMASPAGAYYAVSSPDQDAARVLLTHILRLGHAVPLTNELLAEWHDNNLERGLETLYRLQRLDFVHGTAAPRPTLAVRYPIPWSSSSSSPGSGPSTVSSRMR